MFQFNLFPKVEDFACDKCHGKFQFTTAYSIARSWIQFNHYDTYYFDDAAEIEKSENHSTKTDKHTLNKTGRIHQLGTRVRKEFLKKLKKLARKEKLKYVEVLEKALDYYAEKNKISE